MRIRVQTGFGSCEGETLHNIVRRWFCRGSAMIWRGVACGALGIKGEHSSLLGDGEAPGGASASPPSFSRASVTGCGIHSGPQASRALALTDVGNPMRISHGCMRNADLTH
jgi:hypothetical protein